MLEAEIFTMLWSLVSYKFQIWLVLGNSVIKLSDMSPVGRIYCPKTLILRAKRAYDVTPTMTSSNPT